MTPPKNGSWFDGDASRLLILLLLYIVQGVPFGFFIITLPVMMKKYFTYTELGIIALSTFGYMTKFIFSFVVDTKYIDKIGKRRTWIVPTQIIAGVTMWYLSDNLMNLMEERAVYQITFMFSIVFFWLSLQDIAVDGWALTIVKEKNMSYASSSQNIGFGIGIFLSKTAYFAMNSVYFCNRYIRSWYVPVEFLISKHNYVEILNYSNFNFESDDYIWGEEYKDPIVNEVNFMKIWGVMIVLIAFYVAFFQSEKYDRIQIEEQDQIRSLGKMLHIVKNFVINKNMLLLNFLWLSIAMFGSFTFWIGNVYLLDEMKYSQAKYAFICFLIFPWDVLFSLLFSEKIFEKSFQVYYVISYFNQILSLVFTNIVLYYFNDILNYSESVLDISLFLLLLLRSLVHTASVNAQIAINNKIADPKIGAVHITLLFSFKNFCEIIPTFYLYRAVDLYGLFGPNLIGSVLTLMILIIIRPVVEYLMTISRDNFNTKDTDSEKSNKIKSD
jgi:MFS transporter, PAT family, solute carrier family 33 (acetyl-CoA transportor), member 1